MDAVKGRCPERANLAAFITGALAPHEHDEVARHVAGCADCRSELDEIAPMLPMLDQARAIDINLDEVAVPAGMRERILATVERAGTDAVIQSVRGISPVATLSPLRTPAVATRTEVPPSRRRLLALAAAVVAVLAAVGVGLRLRGTHKPGEEIAMQTLTARDQVQAIGTVQTDPDGTSAVLVIRNSVPDAVYGVWFEDNTGKRIPLGSFRGKSGEIRFRGQSGVRRGDIRAIGAWSNGGDVARADMPKKS